MTLLESDGRRPNRPEAPEGQQFSSLRGCLTREAWRCAPAGRRLAVWSAFSPCGGSLARNAGGVSLPPLRFLLCRCFLFTASPHHALLSGVTGTPWEKWKFASFTHASLVSEGGNGVMDERLSQYPWCHCHLTLQGGGGRPVTERICREHDSVVNTHRLTV